MVGVLRTPYQSLKCLWRTKAKIGPFDLEIWQKDKITNIDVSFMPRLNYQLQFEWGYVMLILASDIDLEFKVRG